MPHRQWREKAIARLILGLRTIAERSVKHIGKVYTAMDSVFMMGQVLSNLMDKRLIKEWKDLNGLSSDSKLMIKLFQDFTNLRLSGCNGMITTTQERRFDNLIIKIQPGSVAQNDTKDSIEIGVNEQDGSGGSAVIPFENFKDKESKTIYQIEFISFSFESHHSFWTQSLPN